MYTSIEPGEPDEPAGQPPPPEPDSADESTRLPLPGELHEPPPVTRDPQDDMMDS